MMENLTSTPNSTTCVSFPDPFQMEKFYLVAVFGASMAAVSLLENILLFFLFISREEFRTSNLFFMTVLAFLDTFIALSYISIMAVGIIKELVFDLWLTTLWHAYLRPMFAASHVCLAASTFLIVSATVERFLATVNWTGFVFRQKHRIAASIVPLTVAVFLNGSVFWEVNVLENKNCTNHARFALGRSSLTANFYYNTIFAFWIRKIVQIILPFFSLTSMNIVIVRKLRQQQHMPSAIISTSLGRTFTLEIKNSVSVRPATRMLVMVVATYLLTNIPNLLIASWEFVDYEKLHGPRYWIFYSFAADVCSILAVFAGAARLPIYCWCNSKVLEELKSVLFSSCFRRRQSTTAPRIRKRISVPLFPNVHSPRPFTAPFLKPRKFHETTLNMGKGVEKNSETSITLFPLRNDYTSFSHRCNTMENESDEDMSLEIMV